MLVVGFPAQAFGTNCFVVAAGPGEQCVVIDPGIGVTGRLDAVLAEHRLHPAAVLLTHGHLDHTFSVTPVCGARGITAYIHPRDRELLADPAKAINSIDPQVLLGGLQWSEPDDVAELTDGGVVSLAGLEFTVDHAPGHTGGSVMFRLPGDHEPVSGRQFLDHDLGGPAASPSGPVSGRQFLDHDLGGPAASPSGLVCFSGDVLFRDSIGRTDLPGGNLAEMMASLRDKVLPLPDDTVVLPGHGPETTIGRERMRNPYLREALTFAS